MNSLGTSPAHANNIASSSPPKDGSKQIGAYQQWVSWPSHEEYHQQEECRDSNCQGECSIGYCCHEYWDGQEWQGFSLSTSASLSSNEYSCWCPHLRDICLFVIFLFFPGYIWHLKHSHSNWHDPFFLHTRKQKKQKYAWPRLRPEKTCKGSQGEEPVMVPCTIVPFFSSIDTVSLLSFIKNLSTPTESTVTRYKTFSL